jgi:RHS repeat-associated protein
MRAAGEPSMTGQTRFLSGLGIQAQETLGESGESRFFHRDLIGSAVLTTDGTGSVASPPGQIAYTGFGEQVWHDGQGNTHVGGPLPEGSPRYDYAGAYGYESGPWGQLPDDSTSPGPLVLYGANPDLPPVTLMHVGARWYQPEIGRFVQRDQAGLLGGANAYSYCFNDPVAFVDAEGLYPRGVMEMGAIYNGARIRGKKPAEASEEAAKWALRSGAIELAGVCIAYAPGLVLRGVVTYVVKTRSYPGEDGAISQIIKKYVDGVLVEVRHVVIRAGQTIHDDIKFRR